ARESSEEVAVETNVHVVVVDRDAVVPESVSQRGEPTGLQLVRAPKFVEGPVHENNPRHGCRSLCGVENKRLVQRLFDEVFNTRNSSVCDEPGTVDGHGRCAMSLARRGTGGEVLHEVVFGQPGRRATLASSAVSGIVEADPGRLIALPVHGET